MWGFDILFAMPRASRLVGSRWHHMSTVSSPHHMSTSNVAQECKRASFSVWHVNHLMSTSHVHIIYCISCQHQASPTKLNKHLWRYPMSTSYFNIKCLPTKQAFIFIDITCQHPLWGYPVCFFFKHMCTYIYSIYIYIQFDLSRPFEDCRTK